MSAPSVGIVCDLAEENWPSMDLVAEMLFSALNRSGLPVAKLRPAMRRRCGGAATGKGGRNLDRLLNRFWDYPRWLSRLRTQFDVFHVIDHSYGQLLHELPCERTIVTCHDLDTFQCLIAPERERRSGLFRAMMRRTLSGFRKAARITCDTEATRQQLLATGWVPAEKLCVAHNGIDPACSPHANPEADRALDEWLGPWNGAIDLLHVGSTIPRKRIDVLLRVFAEVRRRVPAARLVRAGGAFTPEQEALARALRIQDGVVTLPFLSRLELASAYRRAAVVLQPSEREGFGLPVIEAMACGAPVVASDIAALREVGGGAAAYVPVGDLERWAETVVEVALENPASRELRVAAGLKQSAKFTWNEYARKMANLYEEVLNA